MWQVIPYIYSVDSEGNEHNFLADYYRTTQELASNIFRKDTSGRSMPPE
ncbi:Uncharacterised protein [Klebsiella variicola]|nr:Uncharacterised protein [Klebsiella variicola]